jgi:hypothetical protein
MKIDKAAGKQMVKTGRKIGECQKTQGNNIKDKFARYIYLFPLIFLDFIIS